MRKTLYSIFVFLVFCGAVSLSAQTADDIVAKNLAAVGGRDALVKVKSIQMETTTQMMGAEVPSTVTILDGVAFRSDTELNGEKAVQCYTVKGGWVVNPQAGITVPTPMPNDQYLRGRGQIYTGGDLFDYAAKGSKVELLNKDAKTYTLKLTTKDGVETTYVIDAATYLIKSISFKGKVQELDVDITTSFSDYRKTDFGLMMPFAMNVDLGGQYTFNISVTKVQVNPPVPPGFCDMPASTAAGQ